MAKKSKKQAKKKQAKKTAKKAEMKGAKPAGKKGKKAGKKAKKDSLAPKPVKTGKGASPAEVGAGVVEMVRAKAPEGEIWAKWFSPKFVSIEGGQMCQAWHGKAAAKSKADWWYSTNKVHSIDADGPYLGATGFGVRYTIDAEEIASGNRWKGDELAFYTVKNGKVVQEEFMGKAMGGSDEAPK